MTNYISILAFLLFVSTSFLFSEDDNEYEYPRLGTKWIYKTTKTSNNTVKITKDTLMFTDTSKIHNKTAYLYRVDSSLINWTPDKTEYSIGNKYYYINENNKSYNSYCNQVLLLESSDYEYILPTIHLSDTSIVLYPINLLPNIKGNTIIEEKQIEITKKYSVSIIPDTIISGIELNNVKDIEAINLSNSNHNTRYLFNSKGGLIYSKKANHNNGIITIEKELINIIELTDTNKEPYQNYMKLFLSILFLILSANISSGHDQHLIPARGFDKNGDFLEKYYTDVFSLLNKDYSKKPIARYTSIPSFSIEYSFSVELINDKKYIVSNTFTESYFLAKDKTKVKRISNKAEINDDLYNKIVELFQLLAEQTEEQEDMILGQDGTTYYFTTTDVNGNIKNGETWSPENFSLLGRLTLVCDRIYKYGNGADWSQKELIENINGLLSELKGEY
ncbi:MAG: hypothetical protein Kapaf2KO_06430 [Candidatus Kapaibacteriales bacterium]